MESDEEAGSELSNAMRDLNVVLSKMSKEGYREGLGDEEVRPLLQESFDAGYNEGFVASRLVGCIRTKLSIVAELRSDNAEAKILLEEVADIEKEISSWLEEENVIKWIDNKVEKKEVSGVQQLRDIWHNELDKKVPRLKELQTKVDRILEETKW